MYNTIEETGKNMVGGGALTGPPHQPLIKNRKRRLRKHGTLFVILVISQMDLYLESY